PAMHSYQILAYDDSGNESELSDPVIGSALPVADKTPPAAPTGLSAEGVEGKIGLSWTENTESDLAGYFVYRNGVLLNIEPILTTNFVVTGGMKYGEEYSFTVAAVDISGNISDRSNIAKA